MTLIVSHNSTAQSKSNKEDKKHLEAVTNIMNLKKGVLLIRLHTDTNKISKLKENGYYSQAEAYKKELEAKHTLIIDAFKTHYNFSDFYFFKSHHTGKIMNGDYEGYVYDTSGKEVSIIADTARIFILDSRSIEFEAMGTSQLGYEVMYHNFEGIPDPFPSYVRKREALFFLRRDYYDMARILNERLLEFYEEVR